MNLVRWDPFASLENMFAQIPSPASRKRLMSDDSSPPEWAPSVDISETDDEYLLKAQLPAVKKEDVHVTYEDGMLTIAGERKQEKEQKSEKFHRIESFHGVFSRTFALPEGIEAQAIRADSKDGVVTVHVPKCKGETTQPTEIKVQ